MARKQLFRKFFLLMWKNWTLQRRHPLQTVAELLVPVILALLLVLVRSLVDPEPKDEVHYRPYEPGNMTSTVIKPSQLPSFIPKFLLEYKAASIPLRSKWDIAWSPHCGDLEKIINGAISILEPSAFPISFEGVSYPDFASMNEAFNSPVLNKRNSTLAGIAFQDDVCENDKLNKNNLKMTIRFPAELRTYLPSNVLTANWHTNLLFPLYQTLGPREANDSWGMDPGYWYQGFLGLQHAVSSALLDYVAVNKTNSTPEILMQRFPYPRYIKDPLLEALMNFVPLIFMIGFTYNCSATVKAINVEKELQLKETMKIMGLPNWLHWTAWFIKAWMFQMISVVVIVILLTVHWSSKSDFSIFTFTHWSVLLIFLMLFIVATICFDFMISVLFSKANTAALFGGVLWFLSYAPFMLLNQNYADLPLSTKLLSSLASNTAMGFGFDVILYFEGAGVGAHWNSLFKPAISGDNLVLGYIWIMMLVDALLYLLIALYIEAVFPGEFGVPKPWYFPFQRSFWCGSSKVEYMHDEEIQQDLPDDVHEAEPSHLKPGIQIKHLRKVYNEKPAVKDLTLNMYEGEITVLLGHNGAGKTTTLSMLMGMIRPTSGTAIVGGYDIRTQMDEVRASLGICPQHNILFNELTVYEHLYFYGKLKGLSDAKLTEEINKYIDLLELEPKRFSQARTLSGGQKRKLSCGIALCGGSNVVMFDEPTSGMDPAARRALWDILQVEKPGRTMVLTTHFMDEADLLGDRIAIMSSGVLQCCGSSFFLKKRYGAGYHLIIVKHPECIVAAVTNLLRKYIPDITEDQNIGSELSYVLKKENAGIFEQMLSDLEQNKDALRIESYGVSLTTMEEVFLKAGREAEAKEMGHGPDQVAVPIQNSVNGGKLNASGLSWSYEEYDQDKPKAKSNTSVESLTSVMLIAAQLLAMYMKKLICDIRAWYLTIFQIFIPILLVSIGILAAEAQGRSKDLPPLPIELEKYSNPHTPVEVNDTTMSDLANIYIARTSGEVIQGDMSTYMIKKSLENLQMVRDNYIVGATFKHNTIVSWYNNLPYHSPPLALNLAHNAILKQHTNYTLQVVNYPLPYTSESKISIEQKNVGMGFQIAFQIGFSMAFVAAFFIIFPIKERLCKSKHQQFVSGVNVLIFWGTAYIWDFFMFVFPALGIIIVLLGFQQDGFKTAEELGRVFLVLLLFAWAVLPYHYLLSFVFNIPTTGFAAVSMLNILTGVAAFMTVTIMKIPSLNTLDAAKVMDWIFVFVPHYSMTTSLLNMYNNFAYNKACAEIDKYAEFACHLFKSPCCRDPEHCPDGVCLERFDSYFEWKEPGIGRNLTFLFLDGVVLSILLLLIEYRIFHKLYYLIPKERPVIGEDDEEMDSDVANEKEMIRLTPINNLVRNHELVLKEVTKYYGKFLAVNRLSIAIKKGECFGLLGANGAGKTSTFKMMTGDTVITYGEGYLHDLNMKTSMKQVHRRIGYCPQFDALLGNMTGRETLIMFCLLRGIPQKNINSVIKQLAEDLLFEEHIDKQINGYSGGNKRKLSTAIALVGDSSVIFLDEPTSGMDPSARRHLWNVICKVRDSGKSIILTSHSMDECEALCTRLAIMVNGRLKCLGSVQHLKNKYAEGYILILKVGKSLKPVRNRSARVLFPSEHYDVDPVKSFVESSFPGAVLREEYQGLLKYYIEHPTETWSRMFGMLENAKEELSIEDYSLGQASLEQVFLTFTKHQQETT